MKTQFIIALSLLGHFLGYCQDSNLPPERCLIVLENDKKIKSVRLWKINEQLVEYEQSGSLHDIPTARIKVIKLNDEIATFDIHGLIEIRPYDVIISGQDTIQCTITRVTSGNIYFHQQRGFQSTDYISKHMIDSYYHHPDSIVYHSFQDKYFQFASGDSVLESAMDTTNLELFAQVNTKDQNEDYVEYQAKATLQPPGAGRVVGQVFAGTALGAGGAAVGALGGGLVLGLLGLAIAPGAIGSFALVGAGLGGAAGFGLGTGAGVYLAGDHKNSAGRFGPAVGGAYLGLIGSVVIAIIAGSTGIGLALAVLTPAIASTIAFTESRRVKTGNSALAGNGDF